MVSNPDRTNRVLTVDITQTGEVAAYDVRGSGPRRANLVALYMDADEAIDVAVDFGADDADGNVVWFDHVDHVYSATDTIRDSWEQPEDYVRVRITAAGTAGEGQLLFAEGR